MSPRPASRVEVACGFAALAGLGAGILGLAAPVWPWVAAVVVALSYTVVTWVLVRGLAR